MTFLGVKIKKPSFVEMVTVLFLTFVMWAIGFYLVGSTKDSIIMASAGFWGSLTSACGFLVAGKGVSKKQSVISVLLICTMGLISGLLISNFILSS